MFMDDLTLLKNLELLTIILFHFVDPVSIKLMNLLKKLTPSLYWPFKYNYIFLKIIKKFIIINRQNTLMNAKCE
jgi:hypothetical protein